MKKRLLTFFILIFSTFSMNAAKILPKKAVIVISEKASPATIYAAKALQENLNTAFHKTLEIITDKKGKKSFEILVGNTNRFEYPEKNLTEGSYRIKSYQNGIYINGGGNRGVIYGVYRFLEDFCGFHYYSTKTGYNITEKTYLQIEDIDIVYDSFFEYTETDWLSPRDPLFSVINGLNGGECRKIPQEMGGDIKFLSEFCHTLTNQFCSKEKYYKSHPEYFALYNQRRNPNQLCLTNDDVYKIVLEEVLDILKEKYNPDEPIQIISLTQADNSCFCQCKKCQAIDEENKSHAGSMLYFINKISNAVKEAGYDNVFIDTFAYTYTRTPPKNIIPNDNVIIRLCTIECCFSHPLSDPKCEQNIKFIKDFEDWHRICKKLYIWDYTNNYSQTAGLFPNLNVIQRNIQCFYEHGAAGVYEEGNYYINQCDTEFGELKAYLISRCLQNPYCNYDKELQDFLRNFYGVKWKYIYEFLTIINKNASKDHLSIYQGMKKTLSLTDNQIKQCEACWKKAKTGTLDSFQLDNILRSELSWRYWKYCNNILEFSDSDSYEENKSKLFDDFKKFNVTRMKE